MDVFLSYVQKMKPHLAIRIYYVFLHLTTHHHHHNLNQQQQVILWIKMSYRASEYPHSPFQLTTGNIN